jgi:hypothetical protein
LEDLFVAEPADYERAKQTIMEEGQALHDELLHPVSNR